MSSQYDDIIGLPRPKSSFPSMPREKRAAQFMPFAALTGHDEAIKETARVVVARPELDEQELKRLDETLKKFLAKDDVTLKLRVFIPDDKKNGGEIKEIIAKPVKYDEYQNQLVLADGNRLDINNIVSISCYEI